MRDARAIVLALLAAALIGEFAVTAERDWVWASHGDGDDRNRRAFRTELEDEYREEGQRAERYRTQRQREPTTRRPDIAGGAVNEEIDDYPEPGQSGGGTRNYAPYFPNGYNAGQIAGGGVGGGYPGYPGYGAGFGGGGGAGGNGILVGPGGPTGIIGRAPQYYPSGIGGGGYPPQGGQFGGIGGYGAGGPQLPLGAGGGGILPGQPGGIGGFPGGYPPQGGVGYPGAAQPPLGYGVGGGGGGFIGGGYPPQGQLPGEAIGGGGQYPGAYPTAGFPGGVGGGGQFAGQFPSSGAGGGPQYTEGYGLAYLNSLNPFGSYAGYSGGGYDEYDRSKDKLRAEGKSASNVVEGRSVEPAASVTSNASRASQKVDDKIGNSFKRP